MNNYKCLPVFEISGVEVVVYPMIPILSPPIALTVDFLKSPCRLGSKDASMLQLNTGNVTFLRKGVNPVTPLSNSWFPSA